MAISEHGGTTRSTQQVSEQPVFMALRLAAHQGSKRVKKGFIQNLHMVTSLRRAQET